MHSLFNLDVFRAMIPFTSKDQARYYLGGVYVTIDNDGATYVATDGNVLAAYRDNMPAEGGNMVLGSWIIPASVLPMLPKKPKRGYDWEPRVSLCLADGDNRLELYCPSNTVNIVPIDGTYPDWKRVLPSVKLPSIKEDDKTIPFVDPRKAVKVLDFAEALELTNTLQPNYFGPESPVVYTFPDAPAFCIVMPMRRHAVGDWDIPAWAQLSLTQKRQKEHK